MTDAHSVRTPNHSWHRFWCRPQDRVDLGDAGFLFDPESEFGKYLQPNAVALSELVDKPCLVLLGEPGMGKSTAIAHERARLRSGGVSSIGIELRRESSGAAIRAAIETAADYVNWSAGNGTITIFLDGFDEGIARNANLADEIIETLATLPVKRFRVRLSCRTLEWPVGLEQRLGALWTSDVAPLFELLPLRRRDVGIAASDYNIDAGAFIDQVVTRDAQPLATRPISLRFLLQTFSIDGQLPNSKLRLYDEGCRLLCSDEGSWDRARPTADAFRRMAIAARIAAVGTFTNRQVISRQESAPVDALKVVDILGGVETVHGSTYRVDQDSVDDTLEGTALFSLRSTETFGWTHQSYREFLAAWFLSHRELPLAELEQLYTSGSGTVPMPLREVAAWHATMLPDFFEVLVNRDPDVLMRSDTAVVSAPARMQLAAALLRRMDDFEVLDSNYYYPDYRKLAHAELEIQLRPYIRARRKNIIVRRAAIDIAGACRVAELAEDLAAVLRDVTDEQQPREAAARALSQLDSTVAIDALTAVVNGRVDNDPNDEMFGAALRGLWPKHMDAEVLFSVLRPPRRSDFSGAYVGFFSDLPGKIDTPALPIALRWAERVSDVPEYTVVARFRRQVILRALSQVTFDPVIADLLAAIAKKALQRGRGFLDVQFGRRDEDIVRRELTPERRRAVLMALMRDLDDDKLAWRAMFHRPRLIESSDLAWFTQYATPTGAGPYEAVSAKLSAHIYSHHGYPQELSTIESVQEAFDRSPTFREALKPFLAAVQLASQEAVERRDHWEASERLRREAENPDPFDDEADEADEGRRNISSLLDLIERGKTDLWPNLYWTVTGQRFGKVNESEYWRSLDSSEKRRVLSAAIAYLKRVEDVDTGWLDTTTIPGQALAADAAIRLVVDQDPASIDASVWQRWAHALVAAESDEEPRGHVLAAAFSHASEAMTKAIVRIVEREARAHGFISILRELPYPLPAELQQALFAISDGMTGRAYGEVLASLIRSGSQAALDKARHGLEHGGPERAAIDAYLLLKNGETVWRDVIARMQREGEFANALAETLADDTSQQSVVANLEPMDRASLYLTMLRAFTPETDPVRVGGGVVTAREEIARFRNGLLRTLVDAGEADAIQWILEQEPQREFLRWELVLAKQRRADASWTPLELDEFLARARVLTAVVISTADDATLLIFQSPVANPTEFAASLEALVVGLTVDASAERLAIRGPEEAIRGVIALAEKQVLSAGNNRLLGIRSGNEWLFEAVPPIQPQEVIPKDIGADRLREHLKSIDILVMTATDRETDAVLAAMRPLPGEAFLLSGMLSIDTYTLGVLGRYAVAHCQSGMGSTAADGAQFTTGDAIKEVVPKVILLVGIAFGMRKAEHRVGDVLVAKNIRPYEMYKLQPETIAERGSSIPASVKLVKWIKERTRDWRFRREDGSYVRLIPPGDVLSGEKLVNSRPFRDWLADRFPSALGGEMEGIGAYSANQRYGPCEIVLVKAICDWADGCKNDRAQPFAAAAAVSAIAHVLSKQDILLPLGITAAL